MTKWEYKIIAAEDIYSGGLFKGTPRSKIEAYFNELGQDGWEIIDINFEDAYELAVFTGLAKRPVR